MNWRPSDVFTYRHRPIRIYTGQVVHYHFLQWPPRRIVREWGADDAERLSSPVVAQLPPDKDSLVNWLNAHEATPID